MRLANATLDALNTTINTRYQEAYDATSEWSSKVAMDVPSSTALNTYGWMARLGAMRKWVGERVVNNMRSYVYQLLNEAYEFTIGVLRDDIDDDQIGIYAPLASNMGFVTKKWRDQLVKIAIQAGTSQVTFDGVAFFATNHPLSGTSQANLFTTTALTAANLAIVLAAMQSIKGEDGEMINNGRWTLIVPPQLEKIARETVNTQLIANAAGTAAVSNVLQNIVDLMVVPELGNEPTVWYLAQLDGPIKPIVFQKRKDPERVAKTDAKDDNVFWKREYIWGVDARGAAGYGPWWKMARAAA